MNRNGCAFALLSIGLSLFAETAVTVETHNQAGISRATLRGAQNEASRILRSAGILVQWTDCEEDPPAGGCTGAGALTFVLGIRANDPRADSPRFALGFAMVGTERANTACIVYSKILRRVEGHAVVTAGHLLAYAMLHELTHLMLASSAHSSGIMHNNWDDADLRAMSQSRLPFTASQARQLRDAVARRQPVRYASTILSGAY